MAQQFSLTRGARAAVSCRLRAASLLLLAGALLAGPVPLWAGAGADRGDALAVQARSLLDARRGEAAWNILATREADHAGEFAFDYALGMAAVDTGRYDRAIFALERAVLTERRHVGARLELARAYIGQGNFTRAGRELDRVEELTEDARALAVVERYRNTIDRRMRAERRTRFSGFVQLGVGHDSNITVQPDDVAFIEPGETDDNLWSAAARARVDRDLAGERVFYAQADLDETRHLDEDDWDYRHLRGRLGVRGPTADGGVWDASLRAGLYRHELETAAGDTLRDRDSIALAGLHRFGTPPGGLAGLTLFGQAASMSYPEQSGDTGDTNLFLIGAVPEWTVGDLPSWIKTTGVPGRRQDGRLPGGIFALTVAGGLEQETGGRVDGDRILLSGQGRLRWPMANNWLIDVGGGLRLSRFSESRPGESRREDRTLSVSARAIWGFATNWTLRPQARYAKNFSNLDGSEYDRTELLLDVRRVF